MAFADVAEANTTVRLWLPCDEGSGLVLTNQARDGSEDTGNALHANAWTNYHATTRPAVAILTSITANALMYEYSPVRKVMGTEPYGDSVFTAALIRTGGALTSMSLDVGATNAAHQLVKASTFFIASSCGLSLHSETYSTDDQLYAFACFTEAGGGGAHHRRQFALIRYDSNFAETQVRVGDSHQVNPGSPAWGTSGGLDMGGTVDMLVSGGSFELYAMMSAQMPHGYRLGFGRVSDLLDQLRAVATMWHAGTKDIPEAWYTARPSGGVRRGRNRGSI